MVPEKNVKNNAFACGVKCFICCILDGKKRGFAFVQFSKRQDAVNAVSKFHGHSIKGLLRTFNVASENVCIHHQISTVL